MPLYLEDGMTDDDYHYYVELEKVKYRSKFVGSRGIIIINTI